MVAAVGGSATWLMVEWACSELGYEATGRSVSAKEFAFYRVDGARIAEVWGTAFHLELLAQVR